MVDDEDYEKFSKTNWFLKTEVTNHSKYYRVCRRLTIGGKRTRIYLSREIMGNPIGMVVDHIDRNTLNNQKSNLRIVSYSHNSSNSKNRTRWSNHIISNFKGVYWCSSRNKWRPCIRVNGKLIYLGRFESELEAALAYDNAAIHYFKEHACTNKMLGLL
jgi:hypothetical protein